MKNSLIEAQPSCQKSQKPAEEDYNSAWHTRKSKHPSPCFVRPFSESFFVFCISTHVGEIQCMSSSRCLLEPLVILPGGVWRGGVTERQMRLCTPTATRHRSSILLDSRFGDVWATHHVVCESYATYFLPTTIKVIQGGRCPLHIMRRMVRASPTTNDAIGSIWSLR